MTNFDFLKEEPKFKDFADVAISAEKIYPIDEAASVLNCRRAMEFAVKWMYSVDGSLIMPWDDKLVSLMNTDEFRDIVDADLWKRMDFIRKAGNIAAHAGKKINREQAKLCLENLFIFMDFIAYCYGNTYNPHAFDAALLNHEEYMSLPDGPSQLDLKELLKENEALKSELTARRENQQPTYVS